jgi:8-oxo-dGTP pyrophosphatase MutT (NUDIX family)
MSTRQTSCGVIVTDRQRILLGHATRSPRWDIPKGVAELDEGFPAAAAREVFEETGLTVAPDELTELGVYPYLRGKDLALFAWVLPQLPNPQNLSCSTQFALANGTLLPEFDRFGVFPWDEALLRVGKNLARVLRSVSLDALHGPSK